MALAALNQHNPTTLRSLRLLNAVHLPSFAVAMHTPLQALEWWATQVLLLRIVGCGVAASILKRSGLVR